MRKVRERPLVLRADEVRAILAGRKTQLRRVVKPRHDWFMDERADGAQWPYFEPYVYAEPEPVEVPCPFGEPGERLWVRETIYIDDVRWENGPLPKSRPDDLGDRLYYRADGECCHQIAECCCAELGPTPWRPSNHMPRWASRLTLEVTDVRVQRVQDISEEDAVAEGLERWSTGEWTFNSGLWLDRCPVQTFRTLWDKHAKRGFEFDTNPWVWAVSFKRMEASE